jgi:hypothetical protein
MNLNPLDEIINDVLSEDFELKYDEIYKNQLSSAVIDALKIILKHQIAISREQQTLLDACNRD